MGEVLAVERAVCLLVVLIDRTALVLLTVFGIAGEFDLSGVEAEFLAAQLAAIHAVRKEGTAFVVQIVTSCHR